MTEERGMLEKFFKAWGIIVYSRRIKKCDRKEKPKNFNQGL